MTFKKILLTILILGSILRLGFLGSIQAGFFRDEAAIAYNAFSIWNTGADEYGMRLPLVFRSFEVFFLPLYIYMSSLFMGILGPTVFASRLLSAVSGVVAIYFVYLIGKKIWSEKVGLISAFLLAISPWHIFYSRGTFEGNLALTLFIAGFYFWIFFTEKYNKKYFLISGILFCLSMYSYQAERLVVPLFAIVALFYNFKQIWARKTELILSLVIFLIIIAPLLSLSFKAGGYHRAIGVSVFSQDRMPSGWIEGYGKNFFVNNVNFLRFKEILSLYVAYFSPRNLFVDSDYNRQRASVGFSVFYPATILGLVFGVYKLLKSQNQKEKLISAWILLAPIPAALTGDPFHTYRSLLLYAPLTLLSGYGFYFLLNTNKTRWLLFFGISAYYLSTFIYSYVFLNQAARARDWDYGYKEIVGFVKSLPENTNVVIDDPWTEAYIHFLYFGKVDPQEYQKEVLKLGDLNSYYYTNPDEIRPEKIKNVEFRKVSWPTERGDSGKVFVMWAELLPDSEFINDPKVQLLKQINYPDGKIAFKIVKVI